MPEPTDHYTITLRLEGNQLELLRRLQTQTGMTYSDVLLTAVEYMADRLLNKEEDNAPT